MHKENMYESFFSLLKSVYTLDGSAVYSYPEPVFDTWTPPSTEDEASHNCTIIQDADEQSGSDEEILSGAALEIPSVVSQENVDKTILSSASGVTDERDTSNPGLDSISEFRRSDIAIY